MNEEDAAQYAAWQEEEQAAQLAREEEEDAARAALFTALALNVGEVFA